MSEVKCASCNMGITWKDGARITDKGYECLSCAVLLLNRQNKRYRDLFAKILNNECDDSDELADLAEQIAIEALESESE